MHTRIFINLLLATVFLLSCNSGDKSSQVQSPQQDEAKIFPISIQKKGNYTSVDAIRAQARTVIDFRIQNGEKPMSMLTAWYWNPEFVFNAGKISKEGQYEGYWIKYEDDFTYTYGIYDKTIGGGRYHFRLEDDQLILLDNDITQEPKAFLAKNNGELMSYIGRHDFGVNNGMQMKMIMMETQPTKR